MLKSTNHGKDLFFQETSQLSATQGGPNIKERRLFASTSRKPVISFITVTRQSKECSF